MHFQCLKGEPTCKLDCRLCYSFLFMCTVTMCLAGLCTPSVKKVNRHVNFRAGCTWFLVYVHSGTSVTILESSHALCVYKEQYA